MKNAYNCYWKTMPHWFLRDGFWKTWNPAALESIGSTRDGTTTGHVEHIVEAVRRGGNIFVAEEVRYLGERTTIFARIGHDRIAKVLGGSDGTRASHLGEISELLNRDN